MNHSTELLVDADPTIVGEVLADLSTYPAWNDLVHDALPGPEHAADSPDETSEVGHPAWSTTLRAQVGPFARSKQLRLVRTLDEYTGAGGRRIRFERREHDARNHAEWIMEAEVVPRGDRTSVTLRLSYSGGLYTSVLDPILGGAIDRATRRLPSYVENR